MYRHMQRAHKCDEVPKVSAVTFEMFVGQMFRVYFV